MNEKRVIHLLEHIEELNWLVEIGDMASIDKEYLNYKIKVLRLLMEETNAIKQV